MKRIILSVFLLCLLANLILWQSQENLLNIDNAYFIYFYLHNVSLNITLTIATMILLVWSIVDEYYINAHNKCDRMIIQRIGYKAYFIKSIRNIFVKSAIFNVLFEMLIIFSITVLWSYRFYLNLDPAIPLALVFSNDLILNLVGYLVVSTLGTAVFCSLMFSTIEFVKSLYAFRVIAPLMTLSIFVGATFVSPIIYNFVIRFIQDDRLVRTLISFYNPVNLLEPGSEWQSHGYLSFLMTTTFFCIVTYCLINITMKRRKLYG